MRGSIRDRCLRAKEWFPAGSFRRNDNNVEISPLSYKQITWEQLRELENVVTKDDVRTHKTIVRKREQRALDVKATVDHFLNMRDEETEAYNRMRDNAVSRPWTRLT